jgi:serine/threonine protein kinase
LGLLVLGIFNRIRQPPQPPQQQQIYTLHISSSWTIIIMDVMLQEVMGRVDDEWPSECFDKYERIDVLGKGSFGLVWLARRILTTPPPKKGKEKKKTKNGADNNNNKNNQEERKCAADGAAGPDYIVADTVAFDDEDDFEDEFVAIKSIHIKDEKCKVYAEREIRILRELRHPHIIRLIHAYQVHNNKSRVVVMQLARGPNLHQLVVKRGALGLPLSRLVTRQLVAAVSYLHGRAVLHRDIKPSNCILALKEDRGEIVQAYDWFQDDAIWSNKELGKQAVAQNKWKLMLVDFGFARALEKDEIESQAKKMRNSIRFESSAAAAAAAVSSSERKETAPKDNANQAFVPRSMYPKRISEDAVVEDEEDSIEADMKALENIVIKAADNLRKSFKTPIDGLDPSDDRPRERLSSISTMIPVAEEEEEEPMPPKRSSGTNGTGATNGANTTTNNRKHANPIRRKTVARQQVRSMSALGTKAYAAPEIRKELRHKNVEDFKKANAAMTECVADYGMIVDAYSVGWTLRVALTGVLPQFTISEYMEEREGVELEQPGDDDEIYKHPEGCCCFVTEELPIVRIRDPSMLPAAATLLITRLTEKNPEDRMTVREAQNDPYVSGEADDNDPLYSIPSGDVPSGHGDPVVPLECAKDLSTLTVQYHTN